jgi:hypothetical protein
MPNWIAPFIGIVLMACPLAYPGLPLLLWRFLFWGGLAILIFGSLYNLFIKPRLAKEVNLISLSMVIGGILLIIGGIIYYLHDTPITSSTSSPKILTSINQITLHYTQKRIFPIDMDPDQAKKLYVQEAIIRPESIIQAPVALLIIFEGDLAGGYDVKFVRKHLISYQGVYNNQPNMLLISWSSPSFIPDEPLVIRIISSKPAKILKVEQIDYSLVR